ncbi:MAG TPA: heme-binding protein [Pseudolabrys sp.]|nr:heme-binding protein [Pseudolabrys sp.]
MRTLPAAAAVTLALSSIPASGQQLVTHKDLSYPVALELATAALDACKARNYPVSVVVLDRGGNIVVSLKADGAGLHTTENARRKAYTALTFKMTTKAFIEEMKTRPVRREQTTLPGVIAIDGGVPIKVGNDVIGGVGMSGSPGVDEECVNAGLEKVKAALQ